jgi:2'-5' RNA ligase
MQAIATLINPKTNLTTTNLWQVLSRACDLNGIKIPQNPHFSWMVAERFEEEPLKEAFIGFARKTKPFEIHTTGMGIFTGEKPILYLPIVKTEPLLQMHNELWRTLFPMGVNQNTVYHPSQWMPHVTVIGEEVPSPKMTCVLESIISLGLEMTIEVNNLSLIFSNQTEAGIKFVQEFIKDDK